MRRHLRRFFLAFDLEAKKKKKQKTIRKQQDLTNKI